MPRATKKRTRSTKQDTPPASSTDASSPVDESGDAPSPSGTKRKATKSTKKSTQITSNDSNKGATASAQPKKKARKKKAQNGSATAANQSPGGDSSYTQNRLDPNALKVGDRISNVETGRIKAIGPDYVDVVTDGWVRITKDVIRATFRSPDQCNEDIYCSRSTLMNVLRTQVGSHLFKVRFLKQPKKGQTTGDPREMYCVLAKDGINNDFGRSDVWEQVVDDPNTTSYQRRQVDHRTMTDLWFDGKHYIVNTR